MDEPVRENLLHDYLAQRDEPCPLCSYNLRGLQGEHCPECGHGLTLCVNLIDQVRGAYLVGLIGLACAFGFNVLLFVLFLLLTMLLSGGPEAYFFVYQLVISIVTGALLLAWVRSSTRIRRLAKPRRRLLAIAGLLVPILSLAVIVAMIAVDEF
jgi:hypothetical protein